MSIPCVCCVCLPLLKSVVRCRVYSVAPRSCPGGRFFESDAFDFAFRLMKEPHMTVSKAMLYANLRGALHADWLCMVHDTVPARPPSESHSLFHFPAEEGVSHDSIVRCL